MNHKILFRKCRDIEDEVPVAQRHFDTCYNRSRCVNELVIGRYSCLPYYKELEEDLEFNGCKLINSFRQHNWIANFEYYEQLKEFTFKTWSSDEYCQCGYNGPVVIKGKTNSRKQQWSTHMFAADRDAAFKVAVELYTDPLIGTQDLIYRQYVPLKTFEVGIGGMPFANEWRFFYFGTTRLSYGYYWSIADDLDKPYMTDEGLALADSVAKIAAKHTNFFCIDVAEKADGGWVVVELNDGQMSGLSENKPEELYGNLKKTLVEHAHCLFK